MHATVSKTGEKSAEKAKPAEQQTTTVAGAALDQTPLWAQGVPVQFNLKVNRPGDRYEQEADRISEHVMRIPESQAQRRTCACGKLAGQDGVCTACQRAPLSVQPKTARTAPQTPPSDRLPHALRKSFEQSFGASFGSVRIYTHGPRAEDTALSGARAITRGDEITFAPGHFAPQTQEGQALIAHELAHVVQQRRGRLGNLSTMTRLEQEAQAVEQRVLSSRSLTAPTGRSRQIKQRADFTEMLALIEAAALGGIVGAADYIVTHLAKENELIQRIDRLKKLAAKRAASIVLPASLIRRLQALYNQIKSIAPDWLPLPDIQFIAEEQPAAPLLIVAGVAITAEMLILLFAMLIVFIYLLQNLDPSTRRAREKAVEDVLDGLEELLKPKPIPVPKDTPKVEPKPDPKPDPEKKPKPEETTDIFPKIPCPFPTGLTKDDPIPMVWYKPRVDDYYPKRIALTGGLVYGRDDPTNPRKLPLGEPLGVPNKYWPRPGKPLQYLPTERGKTTKDFRAVLTRYGFDWTGLEADHVQDVDWGGPDEFENIWPMSSDANKSAGPRQNQHQRISWCLTSNGRPFPNQSIAQFKITPGSFGRHFIIKSVER